MKKILSWALCGLLLNGCGIVDDYMLGKDNTPKPKALKPIQPKLALKKRWQQNVSQRRSARDGYYKLAPAVDNGVVYTASTDGMVQARKTEDGTLLWQHNLNTAIASGPKISGDSLTVGGADAVLFVLEKQSGKTRWHRTVSNELLAPPVIARGKVFAKTIDGRLSAYSLTSGKQLWQYFHSSPKLILRAASAVTVVDDLVIAGFSDGKLEGIGAERGQLRWTRNISYARGASDVERLIDIDATPIVRNGIAYVVNYQGYVVAISLSNGEFLWRRKLSSYKNMTLRGHRLFIVDADSVVWALNTNSGSVLWRQAALHNRGLTAPALNNNALIVADELGTLHALSLQNGERLAEVAVSGEAIYAPPYIERDKAYVLTSRGALTTFQVGA